VANGPKWNLGHRERTRSWVFVIFLDHAIHETGGAGVNGEEHNVCLPLEKQSERQTFVGSPQVAPATVPSEEPIVGKYIG
jgi:hypothetical protein